MWQLKKEPIYAICSNDYVTRIRVSKLENYTCVQDEIRNRGCYMKAEVIEDFMAPLKETNRRSMKNRLKGDLNSAMCGVSLPQPGDYIMNAWPDEDAFRENACNLMRESYSEKRAAEIREIVKKCPKERRDWNYWVNKGNEMLSGRRN
ncbi:unnamed protein product, partial [Mesorhabditis belari]|uniref:Uncharacterized protein n=1 Tax=Mesorhabditis belari TaxID=2138241 RepID=A0AAF3EPB8_9BILA